MLRASFDGQPQDAEGVILMMASVRRCDEVSCVAPEEGA